MAKNEKMKLKIDNDDENLKNEEIKISKKIKMQTKKESRIPYRERRKLVLEQLNKPNNPSYSNFSNNNIKLFDIEKIREAKEKYIQREIEKIKDSKMTYDEKRLKVLNKLFFSDEFKLEEIKESSNQNLIESLELLGHLFDSKSSNMESTNYKSNKYSINSSIQLDNNNISISNKNYYHDSIYKSRVKNKLLDIKRKNKNINDKELEIAKIIKIQTKKESRLPYRKRRELALKQLNETNVNEYLNLMNNDIILFDIDKIREEKEKFIQRELEKLKDSKMTDYEKRLKILNELNSSDEFKKEEIIESSDNILFESRELMANMLDINSSNIESTNYKSYKYSINSSIQPYNNISLSNDNYYPDNIYKSIMENKLVDIKRKNIDLINKELEIDKIIKLQTKKESRLPYRKRRELALKQLNETNVNEYLNLMNNDIILFDIDKIREEKEKFIQRELEKLKDSKMTDYEKRLKILNELNSSDEFKKEEIIESSNQNLIETLESIDFQLDSKPSNINSTNYTSYKYSNYVGQSDDIESSQREVYYDITENIEFCNNLKMKREVTKNNQNIFLYDDKDLKTYYFVINQKLLQKEPSTINIKNKNFKKEYGLCFCGKEIKEYNKNCKPNEMMCADCMIENKKIYKLDHLKDVLININGRACTIRKGKYHCFGKFLLDDNEKRNCFDDYYTCAACEQLYKIKNYYS